MNYFVLHECCSCLHKLLQKTEECVKNTVFTILASKYFFVRGQRIRLAFVVHVRDPPKQHLSPTQATEKRHDCDGLEVLRTNRKTGSV